SPWSERWFCFARSRSDTTSASGTSLTDRLSAMVPLWFHFRTKGKRRFRHAGGEYAYDVRSYWRETLREFFPWRVGVAPTPLFLFLALVLAASAIVPMSGAAPAEVSADMLGGLKWRNIGPFHGGRIAAVTGAVGQGQAGVFYVGLPAGGIWKSTSAGVTWFPI